MKVFSLISLLLLNINLFATEVCLEQAKHYSAKAKMGEDQQISSFCIAQLKYNNIFYRKKENSRKPASINIGNPFLYAQTSDGKLSISASDGTVQLSKHSRSYIYAGDKTKIEYISNVAISPDGKLFAVASHHDSSVSKILFFTTKYAGNVRPLFVISDKRLKGDRVQVQFKTSNEIIIFNPDVQELLMFSIQSVPPRKTKVSPINLLKAFKYDSAITQVYVQEDRIILLTPTMLQCLDLEHFQSMWEIELQEKQINSISFIKDQKTDKITLLSEKHEILSVEIP